MKTVRKLSVHVERIRVSEAQDVYSGAAINNSVALKAIARSLISKEACEVFLVFHLDVRLRLLGYTEVARGGLSSCAVDTASVLRAALLANAASIAVCHNHPSGDPSPSTEDAVITKKISECAKVVGIGVVDHIVVGETECFSFADNGMMP